jgi:hypothetical protein
MLKITERTLYEVISEFLQKIKKVHIHFLVMVKKGKNEIFFMDKAYEKDFLKAVKNSFKEYHKYGARSNKKIIPLHKWLAKKIISELKNNYQIKSLGMGKEYEIEGKYYSKTEDITILHNQKPIVAISVKFVTSNYSQNSNNYFENLLGETANIRRAGVGFAHFLVLRGYTPYFTKQGKIKKMERLSSHHIEKYIKLFKDADYPHKPDVLGMAIVDFDPKGNPTFTDLKKLELNEDTIKIIETDFSIRTFIKKVGALCELKK